MPPETLLPPDWQHRMVGMIRGVESLQGAWFSGNRWLAPDEQIAVYHRQHELRLYEAVASEIPGLSHLLGEEAEPLLRAYLRDCPSQSWTLNRIADALPGWLRGRDAPKAHVDMAVLDRAVMGGFESGSGRTPRPEELATMPKLALQPHVRAFSVSYDVHVYRSSLMAADVPAPLRQGTWHLVTFRRGLRMRHWVMEPAPWRMLQHIEAGLEVGDALERLVAEGTPIETLVSGLQGWFQSYTERNLVEIRAS